MGPSPAINITIEADVLAAQRGDRQAFTRLVEATCSLVSSIALAIVRDPDLSRDVAQDVFLSAWRDIGKLREPSSFLPWLRQVTRHRAYHILRSLRRGRRRFDETRSDDLIEAAVDPRPDQHQGLVSRETRRLVTDTVDRLPVDAREVVTLYYREGRSVTQVADLLGLSDAAVRQRLARARERLRSDLLDRAGEELKVSAPGAAFVASVSTAIALGAPAAAAAATFGAGAAAKTGSLVAKLAALERSGRGRRGRRERNRIGAAAAATSGTRRGRTERASAVTDRRHRRRRGRRLCVDDGETDHVQRLGPGWCVPRVRGQSGADLRSLASSHCAPPPRSRNASGSGCSGKAAQARARWPHRGVESGTPLRNNRARRRTVDVTLTYPRAA